MISGRPAAFAAAHRKEEREVSSDDENDDNNNIETFDNYTFLNGDFNTGDDNGGDFASRFDRRFSAPTTASSKKRVTGPSHSNPNNKPEVVFRFANERPSTATNNNNNNNNQGHKVKFEQKNQTAPQQPNISRSKSQQSTASFSNNTSNSSSFPSESDSIPRGSLRLKPPVNIPQQEEDDETAASSPASASSTGSFGSIGDNIIAGRSLKLPLSSSLSGRSSASMRQRRMSFAEGQRHQENVETSLHSNNHTSAGSSGSGQLSNRQRRSSCFESSSSRSQPGRNHHSLLISSRHDNNWNLSDSPDLSSPRSSNSLGVPGSPRARKLGSLSPIVLENVNDDEDDKHRLYKTEMCRSWEEHGYCRYGSKCQFAHGWEELKVVVRHNKYKSELCRFFHVDGMCMYGSRCCFIHNINKEDKVKVTSENIYNLKMSRKCRLRVFEEITTGKDITENSKMINPHAFTSNIADSTTDSAADYTTTDASAAVLETTPESEPPSTNSRAVFRKSADPMGHLRIAASTDSITDHIAVSGRAMSPYAEARVAFRESHNYGQQLFADSPEEECWMASFDFTLHSHFGICNLDAIDA